MPLHLDIPTQQQLTALLAARATPSVSLYLPTGHLPHDEAVARIELKNLAHQALAQIEEAGLPSAGVREHLDDLHDDEEFWRTQAISLAVFATPDGARTFRLPNRLTTVVEVSDRYHLKPLLRSVTFPQAAFVLALAQGSVRLVEVAAEVPPRTSGSPTSPSTSPARSARRRSPTGPRSGASRARRARRSGCASTRGRSTPRCARRSAGRGAAHPRVGRAAGVDLPLREQLSVPRAPDHPGQPGDRDGRGAGRGGARRARRAVRRGAERRAPAVRPARFTGARGGRDHRHRAGGDVRRRADAHGGHGRRRPGVRRRGVGAR